MPDAASDPWTARVERTLKRYDASVLRRAWEQPFRPRNQWPADELIQRCLASIENVAVVDRRLAAIDTSGRKLLKMMAHSRQSRWGLGNLVELIATLDSSVDIQPILALLENG